ncbi:hypothetical protein R50072_38030 [Simiduia litorea]
MAEYLGKNTLLETFWNPLRAHHDLGMQHALAVNQLLARGKKLRTLMQHIP